MLFNCTVYSGLLVKHLHGLSLVISQNINLSRFLRSKLNAASFFPLSCDNDVMNTNKQKCKDTAGRNTQQTPAAQLGNVSQNQNVMLC